MKIIETFMKSSYFSDEGNAAELNWLMNIVEDDPEPFVK